MTSIIPPQYNAWMEAVDQMQHSGFAIARTGMHHQPFEVAIIYHGHSYYAWLAFAGLHFEAPMVRMVLDRNGKLHTWMTGDNPPPDVLSRVIVRGLTRLEA